jgi:hypothetical protein
MPDNSRRKRKKAHKLRPGVGATCSVLIRFLHPSRDVRSAILNFTSSQRLEDLLLIKEEEKEINHKKTQCFVFRHDRFPNIELYASKRWTKVEKEGSETQLFVINDEVSSNVSDNVNTPIESVNEEGGDDEAIDDEVEITPNVLNARNTNEDIMYVRGLGLAVDDDNEPAPENVPEPTNPNDEPLPSGLKDPTQSWEWDGFDERKKYGHYNMKARMKGLNGVALEGKLLFELFCYFIY